MAKTEPKIDIAASVAELQEQLRDIQTEHAELTNQIERAEQQRTGAKTDYERALDIGDEAGMARSLKTIRDAVADVPRLQSERAALADSLAPIIAEQQRLRQVAGARIQETEKGIAAARQAHDDAGADVNRTQGVLSSINETRRLLLSGEPND